MSPVRVIKRKGSKKPFKIINRLGHVEGSSTTRKKAEASARIRNGGKKARR
jgi:hypothetical protein